MNFFRFFGNWTIQRAMSVLHPEKSLEDYNMTKVLLISKTTRFEIEKSFHPEIEYREKLIEQGSDFLIKSHEKHKEFEKNLIECLEKLKIEIRIINRCKHPSELVDWADTIVSVGGDGTYLMAASIVLDQSKPVIGFNSLPETSTGYLCLPKTCSENILKTLMDIKQHRFTWAYRTRIHVTLCGVNVNTCAVNVHDKFNKYTIPKNENCNNEVGLKMYSIPQLALNEVFIAESAPASVSYLDVTVDNRPAVTTKSSGICVCTGSGSSSWNFTMNRISNDLVYKICSMCNNHMANVNEIVEKYNNSLRFPADDKRLSYTIRDMIPMSNWPKMPDLPSKGFANKILIKSLCHDGNLVIDGGYSYQFNAGTTAFLETDDKCLLKTIKLEDP